VVDLEDFAIALNDHMQQKALLQVLAIRYLQEHPGTHVIPREEAIALAEYEVAFQVGETSAEVWLMKPEVKFAPEPRLSLVSPRRGDEDE
jgi:hypothetical protein